MKNKISRVTIPGKVIEQLYNDEEFYRDVSSIKKLSLSRFPKNDQWISEDCFNMVFALAGYGPEDLRVEVYGSRLYLSSKTQISSVSEENSPKAHVNHGVVNRGIARRSFRVSYLISDEFDTGNVIATMNKGLLTLMIPKKKDFLRKTIEIARAR